MKAFVLNFTSVCGGIITSTKFENMKVGKVSLLGLKVALHEETCRVDMLLQHVAATYS